MSRRQAIVGAAAARAAPERYIIGVAIASARAGLAGYPASRSPCRNAKMEQ
jgi:hypothetical protein